jgi:hypothetical protein
MDTDGHGWTRIKQQKHGRFRLETGADSEKSPQRLQTSVPDRGHFLLPAPGIRPEYGEMSAESGLIPVG